MIALKIIVLPAVILGIVAAIESASSYGTTSLPGKDASGRYVGIYRVTKDSAVIDNVEVRGSIVVTGKNVTMKNIKLVAETPWHALTVTEGATGFTLEDSEIDGAGHAVNAIYGFGTFLRNDLHDVENGINVIGPSIIRDNFIHNFRGEKTAHFDGIENNGARDVEITGNTIVNDEGQTSAVMLNNYFGSLSNIRIEGNRLVGGGYTVYLDGRFAGGTVDDASIMIINNQIGKGIWGNFAFYGHKPVVYGNVGLDGVPHAAEPATAKKD